MKYFIILFVILFLNNIEAQRIEIGQKAEHIKNVVEYIVQSIYSFDSYGRQGPANTSYDILYDNGAISDVILCYDKQYLIDFELSATFCKHYIMENEKLSFILTQFINISLEKLKSIYDRLYKDYKFGSYYFSEDFNQYSEIYLAKNNHATVKLQQTELSQLPESIKEVVAKKLQEKEEEKRKEQLALEQEKQREYEIKSKTYDLLNNDKSKYEEIFTTIKNNIAKRFYQNSYYYTFPKIPSYYELENNKDKKYIFRNIYNIHLKLENYSKASENYGSVIVAGSYDVRQKNEITLVSGNDTECNLFSNFSIKIPTIKIDGYEVMTEARYNNINVAYTRGITIAEVENDEIKFIEDEPHKFFQSYIAEKIKLEPEGKYIIKYEASNIAGEIEVKTIIEEKPNVFWNTVKIVGGVVLGVLIVILSK